MARTKVVKAEENKVNPIFEALTALEAERGISKATILEGVKAAIVKACEANYGAGVNIAVDVDEEKGAFRVFRLYTVVSEIEAGQEKAQLLLEKALLQDTTVQVGDTIRVELDPAKFSRIAAQNGKSIILQKIREEERESVNQYFARHEREIMSATVTRILQSGMVAVNLDKADAVIAKEDLIPGETLRVGQHVKLYVVEMRDTNKGVRVHLSRTAPNFVKRLFELEVSEIKDGTVEIKAISRESGSRTKMAVMSHDEKVDPIGSCIGVNGARINAVVDELNGEKIDIINWNDNPALLVENALSPAKVIAVAADEDEKSALVVVPDNQLSLAIGMKGQNARLAAKLTGYKIDIKSESQAREEGLFDEYDEEEYDEEDYEEQEEGESEE